MIYLRRSGGIDHMRKHLTAILLSSGAAALALGLGTATAMATTTTTWTIKPGGAVTGSAGKTTLKDVNTGQTLTCASSATAATLKKGSGLTNPLGKITSVTFSTCTGPGGLTFTVATSASRTASAVTGAAQQWPVPPPRRSVRSTAPTPTARAF